MKKEVREGYKMTDVGEIPEEWDFKNLKDICYIKGRIGWQGLRKDEFISEGPYLITGINFDRGRIIWDECYHITNERYEQAPEIQLKVGDVLMTKDGTIGKLLYVENLPDKASLNSHLFVMRPINNSFVSKYFYYNLQSKQFKKYIDNNKTGSTMPAITQAAMEKYKLLLPSIKEQEKIASILSTVDGQIDNTEKLIQKNQELKKGLMQQLLTNGIGHTKFKETEIGEIPEEWDVKKVGDICEVKGGKRLPKGYQLEDEDNAFPYIRVADMYMGGIRQDDIKYVPKDIVDKIKNYKISKDDLFISVAGTLGIVGQVPYELDGANLTENADKLCNIQINKLYLMKVLQSNIIQSIIEAEQTKSAQPKLALTRIKEFLIPVPSDIEQVMIASILVEVDEKIEEYENKKQKLEELKKGLMQQLLTGNIRVV